MNYYNYENETWFERLFGFKELDPDQVRSNFTISGETITSTANNQTFQFGTLPRLLYTYLAMLVAYNVPI